MTDYKPAVVTGGAIILAVILVILLGFAMYLVHMFYVCDNRQCATFQQSGYGRVDNRKALHNLMTYMYHQNSVWSFAIIPSFILALCIPWIVTVITGYPAFNIVTILVVFLLCFLFTYAILQFVFHHYLRPISRFVLEVIDDDL